MRSSKPHPEIQGGQRLWWCRGREREKSRCGRRNSPRRSSLGGRPIVETEIAERKSCFGKRKPGSTSTRTSKTQVRLRLQDFERLSGKIQTTVYIRRSETTGFSLLHFSSIKRVGYIYRLLVKIYLGCKLHIIFNPYSKPLVILLLVITKIPTLPHMTLRSNQVSYYFNLALSSLFRADNNGSGIIT